MRAADSINFARRARVNREKMFFISLHHHVFLLYIYLNYIRLNRLIKRSENKSLRDH